MTPAAAWRSVTVAGEVPIDPAVDFLSDGWQISSRRALQLRQLPRRERARRIAAPARGGEECDISSDGLTYTFPPAGRLRVLAAVERSG